MSIFFTTSALATACAITAFFGTAYVAASPRFARKLFYEASLFNNRAGNSPFSHEVMEAFAWWHKSEHWITASDGKRFHGYLFKHESSEDVVLYCIGRTSTITNCLSHVELLLESGYSVFIIEYRGFGASDKITMHVETICEDGRRALRYLIDDIGYKPEQITLYGESLGTGVASHILDDYQRNKSKKQANLAGIILQSGFQSLEAVGRQMFWLLRSFPGILFPRNPYGLNNGRIMRGKHPPLLILHGKQDSTISWLQAEALFFEASEPKSLRYLEHSDHRDLATADRAEYIAAVSQFRSRLRTTPKLGFWRKVMSKLWKVAA
jgi:alpha-beta hydrolase superfamily lysophospholipase